jgi:predicted protein tyrosine phosphatase
MSDNLMNRKFNSKNMYQGDFKRVLCVCSAGLLRSPTTAFVLSQAPYNFNTRAAGIVPAFALVPVDEVLLEWADEIVCMEPTHKIALEALGTKKPIFCLNITDSFEYRDPTLIHLIKEKYDSLQKEN